MRVIQQRGNGWDGMDGLKLPEDLQGEDEAQEVQAGLEIITKNKLRGFGIKINFKSYNCNAKNFLSQIIV